MCTLSVGRVNGRWIFTHNRDESVKRGLAIPPTLHDCKRGSAYWPIDPQGGGTWWAASSMGDAVFLLNGGFEQHRRDPPYRHSRGEVIPELFQHSSAQHFLDKFSFEGLEPFTLVGRFGDVLFSWVWDGNQLHAQNFDADRWNIWASSTLYSADWKEQRSTWLRRFLNDNSTPDAELIWDFHHSSFTDDKRYDMLMERWGHLRTVAVSQVIVGPDGAGIRYEDRERDQEQFLSLTP